MKLKPMLKFELHDSLRLLAGFYIVITAFPVILRPFGWIFTGNFSFGNLLYWVIDLVPALFQSFINSANIRALDAEIIAFLFIIGLMSFSPGFRVSQGQGVSRKTMFASQLIHMGIISAAAALVNSLFSLGATSVNLLQYNFVLVNYPPFLRTFQSFYNINLFGLDNYKTNLRIIATLQSPQFIIGYFLWTFCIGAMMLMLGYFIGLCFYRLTRGFRQRFTIAAPVLVLPFLSFALAILFAIADNYLFRGIGSISILTPTILLQNARLNTPYVAMLYYLILFAVFAALSYLLIRRVTFDAPDPIKKTTAVNPLETSKGMNV